MVDRSTKLREWMGHPTGPAELHDLRNHVRVRCWWRTDVVCRDLEPHRCIVRLEGSVHRYRVPVQCGPLQLCVVHATQGRNDGLDSYVGDNREPTYSVDGVAVSKNLTRQFLANEDYSGHYGGGLHEVVTGCSNPGFNRDDRVMLGILNITQSGFSTVTLASFPTGGGSCSYAGTLTQAGQMGSVTGSYVCSTGESGTFQLFEMQVNITGVTGRFTGHSATLGCQFSGWFGGLRVTTF